MVAIILIFTGNKLTRYLHNDQNWERKNNNHAYLCQNWIKYFVIY